MESERIRDEAQKDLRELRRRMSYGQVTAGSPLKDFSIFIHGFDADTYESKYEDLQKALKGHAGEMILRVDDIAPPLIRLQSDENGAFFNLQPERPTPKAQSILQLGILAGEELEISKFTANSRGVVDIQFPTLSHVESELEAMALHPEQLSANLSSEDEFHRITFVVGDENVNNWFEQNNMKDRQSEMARYLQQSSQ